MVCPWCIPKGPKREDTIEAARTRQTNASAAAQVRTAQEAPSSSLLASTRRAGEAQQLFPSGCLLLLTFDFYAIQATNYRYVIEALRQSFLLHQKNATNCTSRTYLSKNRKRDLLCHTRTPKKLWSLQFERTANCTIPCKARSPSLVIDISCCKSVVLRY